MATLEATSANIYVGGGPDAFDESKPVTFTGGAANGDVIRLAKVRKGSLVTDLQLFTNQGNSSASVRVGYAPVDPDSSLLADDNAFLTTSAIGSAVRLRANSTVAPTPFEEDVYLTVTVSGAAISASTVVTVVPTVRNEGTN